MDVETRERGSIGVTCIILKASRTDCSENQGDVCEVIGLI